MTALPDYLDKVVQPGVPLPSMLHLIHTTDLFRFRSVLHKGFLDANSASSGEAKVLYLFYGRPAYDVAAKVKSRPDNFYYPVSLLVQPTTIEKAELVAMYPFDSGAFTRDEIRRYVHEDMKLEDFHLGKSLSVLPKLISVFFGDNMKYLLGDVKDGLEFGFDEMEELALYHIIRCEGESELDERRYTVEVQAAKGVLLQPLDVAAVVLPNSEMEDTFVRKTIIEKWNADPLLYPVAKASQPNGSRGLLLDRVLKFYQERGLL